MSKPYTDEDVAAATVVVKLGHDIGGYDDAIAREVLRAVAPVIAARALREFADNNVKAQTAGRMAEDLHARADEIEAGR